jgi:predicted Rossmann fold nucleotide-binding protein DprA/Smf involved in DNA uptake
VLGHGAKLYKIIFSVIFFSNLNFDKFKGEKMRDLKMTLKKVASDLMKVAQKVEEIAAKLDTQAKPSPKHAAPRKQAAQPTAADTVFGIIKRYKKGANMAAINQKTGYDNRKINNLVYKLKKQGKIKSQAKGVYVRV